MYEYHPSLWHASIVNTPIRCILFLHWTIKGRLLGGQSWRRDSCMYWVQIGVLVYLAQYRARYNHILANKKNEVYYQIVVESFVPRHVFEENYTNKSGVSLTDWVVDYSFIFAFVSFLFLSYPVGWHIVFFLPSLFFFVCFVLLFVFLFIAVWPPGHRGLKPNNELHGQSDTIHQVTCNSNPFSLGWPD